MSKSDYSFEEEFYESHDISIFITDTEEEVSSNDLNSESDSEENNNEQNNNELVNIKIKAFNSFGNKNIYLYCVNLEFRNEKQSFKIEINSDGENIVFDNKYCMTKEQPLFI
ncbi:hypothetical protein H8356DRAFT_1068705 [Neocallimastix lanati (nom. inval.)]|uniref:Uncharacterized protein n=1 Tax=Neocallimastix californiae TaxID=1754190 RepID=A0A1Y2D6X8_9FUNG|nr:hypothetical protein H8356DRAFT_1068705 [Neocallimastix sp. JGI-2020a]ORY54914.1 hypothetical protein LY90DRAFT_507335 [Neocallimastix californiae]|eukprot:ORY54914.1 hypothetical protein LY90DRAFT_507335 [Neocallimastix californiae]